MTRYNKKNCTKVLGMIETPLKMYSFKSDINKKILTISQGRILNTIILLMFQLWIVIHLPGQHDLSWECHKGAHVSVFHKLLEKEGYQRILQNINFHVFMIWLTKRSWVLLLSLLLLVKLIASFKCPPELSYCLPRLSFSLSICGLFVL